MKEYSQPRQLCALIITSLPVEYQAVCEYLSSVRKELDTSNVVRSTGIFSEEGVKWDITILTISADNVRTAFETERAIKDRQPEIILFVGIAGKLKENVHLGDVVVATKIYSYEQADNLFIQPEIATTSYTLIQRAHLEARKLDWRERLRQHLLDMSQASELRTPHVILAPIIAGKRGIPTSSDLYKKLRANYSNCAAIEMEGKGYGFLSAVQANLSLQMLVIRGITEPLDDKKWVDKRSASTATHHACAFAFQLLANLGSILPSRRSIERSTSPLTSTNIAQVPSSPLTQGDTPESFEIFFAYAEEDEQFVQRLQSHLSMFKRTRVITNWHSDSTAGKEMLAKQQIQHTIQHINDANIILLLISPDFLVSDYLLMIAERAMERQRIDGVTVIPIVLRHTYWQGTVFGNLQALPRGGRTVEEFRDYDLAIEQTVSEIRTAVEKVKESRHLNIRF